MGLIKAAGAAIGSQLADQWLEAFTADNMSETTAMCKGRQLTQPKKGVFGGGSNTKGSVGIVTNGSKIQVYPNQMMLLVDGGKIVDYTAEEGLYTVQNSSAPSLFSGGFGDSLKDTWERFKFGGVPSHGQEVIFINLQELRGLKFGTRNAINYFDNFYNAELFIRCHGTYSVKITDPLRFYVEVCPRDKDKLDFANLDEQYISEFLTALQATISQLSLDGVRVSSLPSKAMEVSKYMAEVLDEDWKNNRGFEIKSVGVASLSYDDESKQLINMRNQGAMLGDPTIREGFVQGSIARGLQDAGSNPNGAMGAFMGMGVGMNSAGGFMGAASNNNMAQAQAQQQAQQQANLAQQQANQAAQQQQAFEQAKGFGVISDGSWKCECGEYGNKGKFCMSCGKPKPQDQSWNCKCGTANVGKFCQNCGSPKPDNSTWFCKCGTENTGKFCQNCGEKKE
jgi:membrane protease subunit (stomatin/prohibitin family)